MTVRAASLRRSLPAWIVLTIALVVIAFGAVAYRAVRQSDLDGARIRLKTVADRLARVSRVGMIDRRRRVEETAADSAVIAALRGSQDIAGARRALSRLGPDTGAAVATVLQDPAGRTVTALDRDFKTIFAERPDSAWISPMIARNDSLLMEYAAPVRDGNELLGHVVQVRMIRPTSNALRTVTDLVGNGAEVFVGNSDGSLWTDLNRAREGPPTLAAASRYSRGGRTRLAALEAVAGTALVFAVEFPEERVLAHSRELLLQFGTIAAAVIALGAISAWFLSRGITRPLNRLTIAAEAITSGRHPPPPAASGRSDEIGRLDQAFRAMAESVRESRENLEHLVAERTRALEEAQATLVRKERMAVLGQMAGSVGHEIRNPLGVMNNAVYYIRSVLPDAPPKVKDHLGIIEQQIKLTEKIVADILDFSRIKPPEKAEVPVEEFVEDQVRRIGLPSEIRIERDLDPDLPPMHADPSQVGQIMFNILTNAIQALDGKDGIISIRCRDGGDRLRIEIEDDGPGIPEKHLDQIFEPLFTTKTRGFGLGLSLSRSLAHANGGELTVANARSRGAIFTLYVPTAARV